MGDQIDDPADRPPKKGASKTAPVSGSKDARLAAALRANLGRRKASARLTLAATSPASNPRNGET